MTGSGDIFACHTKKKVIIQAEMYKNSEKLIIELHVFEVPTIYDEFNTSS